jgi:transposase
MSGRRKYTKEFRLQAIGQVLEEQKPLSDVARELGLSPALLSRWKTDYLAGGPLGAAPEVPTESELKRLRAEVARLRQERDFLKKAVGFFAQESS